MSNVKLCPYCGQYYFCDKCMCHNSKLVDNDNNDNNENESKKDENFPPFFNGWF